MNRFRIFKGPRVAAGGWHRYYFILDMHRQGPYAEQHHELVRVRDENEATIETIKKAVEHAYDHGTPVHRLGAVAQRTKRLLVGQD